MVGSCCDGVCCWGTGCVDPSSEVISTSPAAKSYYLLNWPPITTSD